MWTIVPSLPGADWAERMAGGNFTQTPEQAAARAAQRAAELVVLRARLNDDVDDVVRRYLPLAQEAGRFWELGSPDGAAGQSLKINRSGMKGVWTWYKGSGFDRAGSMLDLIVRVGFGGDFGAAMKVLRGDYNLANVTPEQTAQFRREAEAKSAKVEAELTAQAVEKQSRARALWHGAVPIARTPAEAYLRMRVPGWEALGRWPRALKYRPDVNFCPVRGSGPERTGYPAMLAAVFGPDGAIVAVHGTFLDITGWDHATKGGAVRVHKVVRLLPRQARDGRDEVDAAGKKPRPFLLDPANSPSSQLVHSIKSHKATLGRYAHVGGYIPLRKGSSGKRLREVPAGTIPHFSEGIEDGLNYAVDHPDAWIGAAVSLANMANVWLPEQAGGICFLADRDAADNLAAADSFEAAVAAHQARRDDPEFVRAVWPAAGFKDFSDMAVGLAGRGGVA